MKKALIILSLFATIGTAQANMRPMYPPMTPAQSYQRGYNYGYSQGKHDQREKVAKAVGVSILVVAGALIVYELAKPSAYNQGQIQLAQF